MQTEEKPLNPAPRTAGEIFTAPRRDWLIRMSFREMTQFINLLDQAESLAKLNDHLAEASELFKARSLFNAERDLIIDGEGTHIDLLPAYCRDHI